ncbi:MAG: LON peptidase substrate-binding domain-containing protein [Myxococcota bacterium]
MVTPLLPAELQRLPMFPLPKLVFFPHTLLPLHIFEPRYRKMTADVLAQKLPLAIVQLKEGARTPDEVFPVAGVGRIVEHRTLPDGRYQLMLAGVGRVRIREELDSDQPYRVVQAELLSDELHPTEQVRLHAARLTLQGLALSLTRTNPRLAGVLSEILRISDGPATLADVLASIFVPDPAERQLLLETLEVEKRLSRVIDAVAEVAAEPPAGTPSGQLLN